ncbi:unnamed protein product [Amoebophrya sp. A25]|nr:unnamed protein product [Amoebophrya sp. A25]|eukprot:GSA25T00014706001.1
MAPLAIEMGQPTQGSMASDPMDLACVQEKQTRDLEAQNNPPEDHVDRCYLDTQMEHFWIEGEHQMASKPIAIRIPMYIIGSILTLVGLAFSVFFLVLWLLLMPIKCCTPAGFIVSIAECLMQQGVKLPLRIAKCFF